MIRATALLGAVLLAGCASIVPPTLPPALSGRLAWQVEARDGAPARSASAVFDLRGDAKTGELQLSSPLGTTLAQARWSHGAAELSTSDGRTRYNTLDELAEQMLGETLPMAALIDWLHGRPWPDAPSQPAANGFAQLDWTIDTSRFADGTVVARRERAPAVTVRARLDEPARARVE